MEWLGTFPLRVPGLTPVHLVPRLHSERSGRLYNRWNNRSKSTSRERPHRTPPSDHQGGASEHQPTNVALPTWERQRRRGRWGRMRQTSSMGNQTKELHWGKCNPKQIQHRAEWILGYYDEHVKLNIAFLKHIGKKEVFNFFYGRVKGTISLSG